MTKKTNFYGWKTAAVVGLFSISAVHASYIDFSSVTPGTQITNQYAAQGVTITTKDANGSISNAAIAAAPYSGGLANSTSGTYPTTEWLDFNFTDPVTLNSFTFNNYGDNADAGAGDSPSYYNAYDAAHTLIDSGFINTVQGSSVVLNRANVSMLQINNGTTAVGNNWEFIVGSISYTAIPEPTTLVLAGLSGLGLLAFRRFRRRA